MRHISYQHVLILLHFSKERTVIIRGVFYQLMILLLLMLVSPLAQSFSPLGLVVLISPCWNYLLSSWSWFQHNCFLGFINFFLILRILPEDFVAHKFCVLPICYQWASFFPRFANLPLGLRSLKHIKPWTFTRQVFQQVIWFSHTWKSFRACLLAAVSWIRSPFLLIRLESMQQSKNILS